MKGRKEMAGQKERKEIFVRWVVGLNGGRRARVVLKYLTIILFFFSLKAGTLQLATSRSSAGRKSGVSSCTLTWVWIFSRYLWERMCVNKIGDVWCVLTTKVSLSYICSLLLNLMMVFTSPGSYREGWLTFWKLLC